MSCRVKPRSLIQSTFVILYIGPIKRTPLYFIVENPVSGWRISTGFFSILQISARYSADGGYPTFILRICFFRISSFVLWTADSYFRSFPPYWISKETQMLNENMVFNYKEWKPNYRIVREKWQYQTRLPEGGYPPESVILAQKWL